jgi:hypothetical protein
MLTAIICNLLGRSTPNAIILTFLSLELCVTVALSYFLFLSLIGDGVLQAIGLFLSVFIILVTGSTLRDAIHDLREGRRKREEMRRDVAKKSCCYEHNRQE